MNIYSNGKYKKLFIIPIILLVISLFFMTQLKYGMEFKGGSRITVPLNEPAEAHKLEKDMNSRFKIQDLSIKQTQGIQNTLLVEYAGNIDIIEIQEAFDAGKYEEVVQRSKKFTGEIETNLKGREKAQKYLSTAEEEFKSRLTGYLSQELNVSPDKFSFNSIGASLGMKFLEQSKNAIFAALLFIAVLVFYFFRRVVTSLAVFQAAVYDIIFGLGAMGIFQIPLTLGTIAALLMLIGYSIDSDIMLTDRIMKRKKGTPEERAFDAMKTGLTMTGTTLSALMGLFAVSYLVHIQILISLSTILIIGLIGDLIATWFTNAPLVIWDMKRKKK